MSRAAEFAKRVVLVKVESKGFVLGSVCRRSHRLILGCHAELHPAIQASNIIVIGFLAVHRDKMPGISDPLPTLAELNLDAELAILGHA